MPVNLGSDRYHPRFFIYATRHRVASAWQCVRLRDGQRSLRVIDDQFIIGQYAARQNGFHRHRALPSGPVTPKSVSVSTADDSTFISNPPTRKITALLLST